MLFFLPLLLHNFQPKTIVTMGIKVRLTVMNFFQFFIWGSWLITIGAFWFQHKQWSGAEFGAIFSTMGISSLFMPAIAGIIADRYISAQKLLGIFHLAGAALLYYLPNIDDPGVFFWVMLVNMMFYMPTISLTIAVAYTSLKKSGLDIVTHYPPIRVWGTVGFIVAMWIVSLLHIETSSAQFYVAAGASLFLGLYAFTLPDCPPAGHKEEKRSLFDAMGLNAFSLFKNYKMALFFMFAMLLGAALQLTNMYGDTFLHDFAKIPEFQNLIAVRYPAIIMSVSQISETLFILAIPFFLKRFGIKKVMLFSMIAWVFRFGLFSFGDPAGGLWMIILSGIIYGMAFDFFNISGSLYVETQSHSGIRASAQGLFMMMTNGFGALAGSYLSGILIDEFFLFEDGSKNWSEIWMAFAIYALVITVAFAILFKHKHNPDDFASVKH